jgi:outer membrane receptor protein involved in Fe transport
VEWTNAWRVSPRLSLDLDATYTEARFTDADPAGDEIPGAIVATVAAGLSAQDVGRRFGAVRLRYFSGGPLIEDGSVDWGPTALLSARVGLEVTERLQILVDGFNLLGREDEDIAYFYASRLPGERLDGVEDVHYHPAIKPSVRATLVWRF